jgi:hypothetical protein
MPATIPFSIFTLSSDETLATGTKARMVAPCDGKIVKVTGAVVSAPAGSSAILDVNIGGTTIFTTQANRPTVAAGATSATTGVAQVVEFSAGDVITVDVDQVGSGTAGTGFMVAIAYEDKDSASTHAIQGL